MTSSETRSSTSSALTAYLALLLLLCAYHLLRWPIAAGDADVWFHLNTGRYIWQHRQIPADSSFFSFISPPRPWVDYSWLFDVTAYSLQAWLGWYGLIVLRTFAFTATLGLIGIYLLRTPRCGMPWYPAVLCALYAAILMPRYKLIRPHMCTELFIVLCIYILEICPRKVAWLPFAAVLWANLHGIYYPLLLWICGAFIAEHFWRRIRSSPDPEPSLIPLGPVTLAVACIFLTPHGPSLLPVPFIPMDTARLYIQELIPLTPLSLLSFKMHGIVPTHQSLFNALLGLSLLNAISAFRRNAMELRHMLLFLGGILLLTQGARFIYESSLLLLPTLGQFHLLPTIPWNKTHLSGPGKYAPKIVSGLAAAWCFVLPPLFLQDSFGRRPVYPLSEERLPRGVSAFLNRFGNGGRVLNHPNYGGYLEWTLAPDYKIFMDMRVPQMFTEEDFLHARGAHLDASALGRLLKAYDPPFITTPLAGPAFREVIRAFPDFVPVFFDDAEVLYADRRQRPSLALSHRLTQIDPWEVSRDGIYRRQPRRGTPLPRDLTRLIEIDPHCLLTRQLAAQIHLSNGEPGLALEQARVLVADFPEYPVGYLLEGQAYKGLGRREPASASFRQALRRSDGSSRAEIMYEMESF